MTIVTIRKPSMGPIAAAAMAVLALAGAASGATPSDKPKSIQPSATQGDAIKAGKKASTLSAEPRQANKKRRSSGRKDGGGPVPPSPPLKTTPSDSPGGGHGRTTGSRK